MVGMLIFAIGLTGIYALLNSTFRNAAYSRHEMVAANLLQEQIELIKNIRDTNIASFVQWDTALMKDVFSSQFQSWIYLIENDYSTATAEYDTSGHIKKSPVYMKDITSSYMLSNAIEDHYKLAQLSTDSYGRYTHTPTGSGTFYASYIILRPISVNAKNITKDGNNQGYTIDARVIVHSGNGYREYDARSAITDWIR